MNLRYHLNQLFPRRTRITREDKNIILRALELKMEKLQPDFATAFEKREWLENAPVEFTRARDAYEKIYNHKPNGKVF